MTHREALKLRTILSALLSLRKDHRFQVAIQERFAGMEQDSWEIHLFLSKKRLSGMVDLALLAHVIEQMSDDYLACESEYDISTTGERDMVPSIKIW